MYMFIYRYVCTYKTHITVGIHVQWTMIHSITCKHAAASAPHYAHTPVWYMRLCTCTDTSKDTHVYAHTRMQVYVLIYTAHMVVTMHISPHRYICHVHGRVNQRLDQPRYTWWQGCIYTYTYIQQAYTICGEMHMDTCNTSDVNDYTTLHNRCVACVQSCMTHRNTHGWLQHI